MPIRWRYVLEGELPDNLAGTQLEEMVRSSVSVVDTLLLFIRSSRVEFAQDGAPTNGTPKPLIERLEP